MSKFKNTPKGLWNLTYPVDGIHFGKSLVEGSSPTEYSEWVSVNGKKYYPRSQQWRQAIQYCSHPLTQATAFFGISNRVLNLNKGQSWRNIFNNFVAAFSQTYAWKRKDQILFDSISIAI